VHLFPVLGSSVAKTFPVAGNYQNHNKFQFQKLKLQIAVWQKQYCGTKPTNEMLQSWLELVNFLQK